jgi:transcriptional regulator with XRE-family HTH domain
MAMRYDRQGRAKRIALPVPTNRRSRPRPLSVRPLGLGLGLRLRHARLSRRLKLKELAAAAGCSVSLVSKIENDKALPSITMLHRLVEALGTNVSALFARPEQELGIVSRKGSRPIIPLGDDASNGGVTLEILSQHRPDRLLQASIHNVSPGGGSEGTFRHEGEEVGYVLEGTLELTVDSKTYLLKPGDSFVFRSELFHGYCNPGRRLARIVWVNTPPTF